MESSAAPRRGRLAGALVALLVATALLALVAVAARGDTPSGTAETRRPSHLLIDTLVSLYILLMLVGAAVFVWLFLLRKDSPHERKRLRREGRIRSFVVVGLFLGGLALALRIAENRRAGEGEEGFAPATLATTSPDAGPRGGYEPEFATAPVLIVAGIVALAVLALAIAARRRRRALGSGFPHVDLAAALEEVLAESLDDLRAEQDPRRAVVAAYARLERTLAAYGLPRSSAEAPAEYLARMLESLEVSPRSVGRLTALFERAKFSQHDVDTTMKDDAIEALEAARDELRRARERELAERAAALQAARERAAQA